MIKFELRPPDAQLLQFGWIALFGFPAVGAVFHLFFGASSTAFWILAAVGVVVFGLSRVHPLAVLPVFDGLMIVTLPIGFVISFALTALIYYGMVTPLGLFFRLTGRDRIPKRPDRSADTYWEPRGEARPPASYFRLY
jgi:hypothetical protein